MCSFTTLCIWLGFLALLNPCVISAASDDPSFFNPTDTTDLDLLWGTNDVFGLSSLGDAADECIPFDSGYTAKVRARGLCSELPPPVNDGDLFGPEGSLTVEGFDGSYDTLLSDSDPTSDVVLAVGATCRSGNPQSIGKLRTRNSVCKNPTVTEKDPSWDPDLDQGIYKQGHPDYEYLRLLPFVPGDMNDAVCPRGRVGQRYAVCGPANELYDVIGEGITLRNVELCM